MSIDELARQLLAEYKADGRHAQIEYCGIVVRADLFGSVQEYRDGKWHERGRVKITTELDKQKASKDWYTGDFGDSTPPHWTDGDFLRVARLVFWSLKDYMATRTMDALGGLGE